MKKFFCSVMAVAALLCGCAKTVVVSEVMQQGENDKLYTKYNIFYTNPEKINCLNFISGKELDYVNKTAMVATLVAHNDGGVPNIVLDVEDKSAYSFGYLVYFFEFACAISGYMLGVNPFDQPGVEAYKKNMFALLGKPGYEEMKKELDKRINGD